jgi:glutamate synthase (NADPH/NADH) small chain
MKILPKKTPVRRQPAEIRRKNFNEVSLGYNEEEALAEANRCLQCKNPVCIPGCPVEIDIPAFIKKIQEKDYLGAIRKIKEKNSLPAICGRVCPQEEQCEKVCVLAKKHEPVGIGRLERFAADFELVQSPNHPVTQSPKLLSFKIAIIGSGPAGLTCAGDLARMGYHVSLFEALHKPGGVLVYGIPEFRLPKKIVEQEVAYVQSLGVELKLNYVIGRTFTISELFAQGMNRSGSYQGYNAIFIGIGAGAPKFMGIPGENLNGVYSANEFLTRVNLMKAYLFPGYDTPVRIGKRVAVVGGGNVAMDSARTALRLGAEEVYLIYRRSRKEMPAREEEIENALEEGIKFELLTNPVRIVGNKDGWVEKIECVRMELGAPDASGRARPVEIKGSNFYFDCETIITALGTDANPLLPKTTAGLELNKWGYIITDEQTGKTSLAGVYAGGDIVTGSATVISAMGAGKRAARAIDEYLKQKKV